MSSSPKSRLITSESLTGVTAWEPPVVRTPDLQEKEDKRLLAEAAEQDKLTAATLEELQQQAHKEGYDKGYNEGMAGAKAEISGVVSKLNGLMKSLTVPFENLDDKVIEEMSQLAILIAKQLVRRELKIETGQVVSLVRETVSYLPVASQNIRVMLHPDDAVIVREALSVSEHEQRWELVEDPVITRGGCKVVTESARIDMTIESQLNAVIANILGGEREDDSEDVS